MCDACLLLSQASVQLSTLPATHPARGELLAAINALEVLLTQGPTADTLTTAMSRLTQAMAAAQQVY